LIKVRALGVAKSFMGDTQQIDIEEGASVGELLMLLPKQLREMATRSELSIIVGGADVSAKEGLATRLHDGDEVIVLPFAHGGGS
jgi:molybdopterin converting factor small subunit